MSETRIQEGLPGLIFSGFIFPEELFIYCRFINRIKISAHPHSHYRLNSHPHSHFCSHLHPYSSPHPQDCVGFISIYIEIFQ
jgi:hypothetical protein